MNFEPEHPFVMFVVTVFPHRFNGHLEAKQLYHMGEHFHRGCLGFGFLFFWAG